MVDLNKISLVAIVLQIYLFKSNYVTVYKHWLWNKQIKIVYNKMNSITINTITTNIELTTLTINVLIIVVSYYYYYVFAMASMTPGVQVSYYFSGAILLLLIFSTFILPKWRRRRGYEFLTPNIILYLPKRNMRVCQSRILSP